MKHLVFAVYDHAGEHYGLPIFFAAKGQAVRAFTDQANDKQSQIYKHADDYELFHLGEYETDQGLLTPIRPSSYGKATDYKKADPNLDLFDEKLVQPGED